MFSGADPDQKRPLRQNECQFHLDHTGQCDPESRHPKPALIHLKEQALRQLKVGGQELVSDPLASGLPLVKFDQL
jgi:hypothetical protein